MGCTPAMPGVSEVQDHPQPCSKLEANLGYVRSCFKTTKKQEKKKKKNPLKLYLYFTIVGHFCLPFAFYYLTEYLLNNIFAFLILLVWNLPNSFQLTLIFLFVCLFWSVVMPQATAILLAVNYMKICHIFFSFFCYVFVLLN